MTAYFIRKDDELDSAQSQSGKVDLFTIGALQPTHLSDLKGKPAAQIAFRQFLPLSQARETFLRQSDVSNRPLKNYLSQFIQPNTEFLEALSIERWESAQSNLKNEIVFERGDIIVRQGGTITKIIKEALDLMIVGLRYDRLKDSVKIELARDPGTDTKKASRNQAKIPEEIPVPEPESRDLQRERPQGKLPPILSRTTVAQTSSPKEKTESSVPQATAQLNRAESTATVPSGTMNAYVRWMIGLEYLLWLDYWYFSIFGEAHLYIYLKNSRWQSSKIANKAW